MNYEAMPAIRLEVEGMKASIMTHLGVMGSEMGEAIDGEVQRAVDSYPWKEKVSRIVNGAITEHIQGHFLFGAGATAIKQSVEEAFSSLVKETA